MLENNENTDFELKNLHSEFEKQITFEKVNFNNSP